MSVFLHFFETNNNCLIEFNDNPNYQSIGKIPVFTYKILSVDKISDIIAYLNILSDGNGLIFNKNYGFEKNNLKLFLNIIGTNLEQTNPIVSQNKEVSRILSSSPISVITTPATEESSSSELSPLKRIRDLLRTESKKRHIEEEIEEISSVEDDENLNGEIAPARKYIKIDFENYLSNRQFVRCKDYCNTDVGIYFTNWKKIMFDKTYYSPRDFVRKIINKNTGDNTYVTNEEACYKLEKRMKNGEWVPLMNNHTNGEWIEARR